MVLTAHIVIAIISLIFATYTFYSPSRAKLRTSYVLVAVVLLSGGYLAWTHPGHLASVCTTGLTYIGFISMAIIATRSKLARS